MGEQTKSKKVVISVGDLPATDVFTEYISGLPDAGKVAEKITGVAFSGLDTKDSLDDVEEYKDEELRLGLERLVSRGKSVLIIGNRVSGKTTLLKRLIRKKATAVTGLVVVDGVTADYIAEVNEELQDRGLSIDEDVSILATLDGGNVNFGVSQFAQYWNGCNKSESILVGTNPIDVVVLMDKENIVGLFGVRKSANPEAALESLSVENTKMDVHQNAMRDKAVEVVKGLIDSGNRVMLITDDEIPAVKEAVVRMLAYELSKTRNVTMYGTAAAHDKTIKDSNIVTAYGYGYEVADWEEFQIRLADKNKPIDFLLFDRGCEYGFYETINHLAKGNPGCIVDGYVQLVENRGDLSFYASRYMTGAKVAGEVNYTMTDIFDDSELNNKVLTGKMYPAIDKVVTVTKKGVITLYSVDKTGGYALIKE